MMRSHDQHIECINLQKYIGVLLAHKIPKYFIATMYIMVILIYLSQIKPVKLALLLSTSMFAS